MTVRPKFGSDTLRQYLWSTCRCQGSPPRRRARRIELALGHCPACTWSPSWDTWRVGRSWWTPVPAGTDPTFRSTPPEQLWRISLFWVLLDQQCSTFCTIFPDRWVWSLLTRRMSSKATHRTSSRAVCTRLHLAFPICTLLSVWKGADKMQANCICLPAFSGFC